MGSVLGPCSVIAGSVLGHHFVIMGSVLGYRSDMMGSVLGHISFRVEGLKGSAWRASRRMHKTVLQSGLPR